ncbi:MAG: hypothetical protein KJS97_01705 [Alphaproteobacteria bacterium]|nr:hypothetical protein [Alphaproteobacteria bacterium]
MSHQSPSTLVETSGSPGFLGGAIALAWVGVMIYGPLATWGVAPLLAQPPGFLAMIVAAAVFPALGLWMIAGAWRSAWRAGVRDAQETEQLQGEVRALAEGVAALTGVVEETRREAAQRDQMLRDRDLRETLRRENSATPPQTQPRARAPGAVIASMRVTFTIAPLARSDAPIIQLPEAPPSIKPAAPAKPRSRKRPRTEKTLSMAPAQVSSADPAIAKPRPAPRRRGSVESAPPLCVANDVPEPPPVARDAERAANERATPAPQAARRPRRAAQMKA